MLDSTSRDVEYSAFDERIQPYYIDMKKYCMNLTKSAWEAEDLLQDCMMKLYLYLKKHPDQHLSKRYLYRMAQNTWIDIKRKKMIETDSLDGNDHYSLIGDISQELNVREALEVLADFLTVKQFVIVLLIDIFQFTAKETAQLIRETESNIHTTLHRSRKKLQRFSQQPYEQISNQSVASKESHPSMPKGLFERFMEGFRRRDPKAIYDAYLSLSRKGIQVANIQRLGYKFCFSFQDPDGNVLVVCSNDNVLD